MHTSRGLSRTGSLLVVIAVLAAACSSGADRAGGAGSFRDRLALLPASAVDDVERGVLVAMADLDRAAELAGVERPADASDVDALIDYVNAVTGIPGPDAEGPATVAALTPDTAQIERLAQVGEFDDEVGWSIADVSWFAETRAPPNTLMVAGGDFDESRLTDAMGDRQDGMWRLGGEDGEVDVNDLTAARPLGESLRLALDDGNLIVGRSAPPVEDAIAGDGRTLADDQILRALAQAMDDEDAYSALFSAGGIHTIDPAAIVLDDDPEEALVDAQDQVLPQPFRGVAAGLTSADGEAIMLLAYVHDTAEAANANAEALPTLVEQGHTLQTGEPWNDMVKVDEVSADGSTVVARLGLGERRSPPQLPYRLLMLRESIVSHR